MFYAIIGLHSKLGLAALGLLGLKLKTACNNQKCQRSIPDLQSLMTDNSNGYPHLQDVNTTYIRLTAMLNCPASAVADYALPNISSYAIRLRCLQRERRDFLMIQRVVELRWKSYPREKEVQIVYDIC